MRVEDDYQTNNYELERTNIGNFFYKILNKVSAFLMKHMWLYYVLNYTWGIILTIVGWIVLGFLHLFFRKKIVDSNKFGPAHYVMIFHNWGGLELGCNFILAENMGDYWTFHTKCHEMGHTFQNAILGPFMIFLVSIPSAIRYWYQRIRTKKDKFNKPYDAAWFEESATDIGTKYYAEFFNK